MKASDILKKYQKLVRPLIASQLASPNFPTNFLTPKNHSQTEKLHWEITSDYPNRKSKYLRPTLLLLTKQALTNQLTKADLLTAAAMQLSEEWLLIFDDIQDKSPLRRGQPALHLLYSEELALNAGITLHSITNLLLSQAALQISPQTSKRLTTEFHSIITRTALGQTAEILSTGKLSKAKYSDWFYIADGKTSYYTIAGPMRLGAILAGATPKQLDLLSDLGQSLGRCFQLTDDLLDLTSTFGGRKQKAGDLYEGKITIPLIHLLKHSTPTNKQKLLTIFQKPPRKKTKVEIDWILEQLEDAGSLTYTQNLANKENQKSLQLLNQKLTFLKHQPYKDYLSTLANFIINRTH